MNNTTKNSLFSMLFLSAMACGGASTSNTELASSNPQPTEKVVNEALPDAAGIISRYIEVTGGEAAYAAIKNFKVTGTFALPAQKIEGALTIVGADGGRMVFSVDIPGIGTERSGSDGTTVWAMSAMTGSRILEGTERERMLRDADLQKELNWKTYYKSATTTKLDEVDGNAAYVVDMVDNYDVVETRYYDKESGLLVRTAGKVKSQMGEMMTDSRLTDYQQFAGVLMPKTVEVSMMGMKQVVTIKSVEMNVEFGGDEFALPDDIKALSQNK